MEFTKEEHDRLVACFGGSWVEVSDEVLFGHAAAQMCERVHERLLDYLGDTAVRAVLSGKTVKEAIEYTVSRMLYPWYLGQDNP